MSKLTAKKVEAIFADHTAYWQKLQPEMRMLRAMYMQRYWDNKTVSDETLRIETSRAYELIESYVASLYTRDPSVLVTPDMRGRGNPEVARAVANDLLQRVREQLEDATRLALIYPCSFIKLFPTENPDPLRRIGIAAIPPWDIIVDAASGPGTWESQRWVGHTYLLPLADAFIRYGKKTDISPRQYTRYVDLPTDASVQNQRRNPIGALENVQDRGDEYLLIVEIYDMLGDRLVIWSPDYASGKRFLFEGVKIQVGSTVGQETPEDDVPEEPELHKYTGIPYRSASGRPVIPIVGIYMSRDPDQPVRGYSTLYRVSDQIQEINQMRTYQAQGVRRMARQWLSVKGIFTPEDQAKIAAGVDGEIIELELSPGQTLSEALVPFPQMNVPPDLERYATIVDSDFARGSVMAPFTRGEASGVTATEVTALASTSSSEIGRMARARDAAISEIARVGNIILSLILGEDTEPLILSGKPTLLTAADLTGDFRYYAQDGGSSPLADAAKREQIVALAPLLQGLGVAPDKILASIVRAYDLPEDFSKLATPEGTTEGGQPPSPPGSLANTPPAGELPPEMQGGPSPQKIQSILGGM